MALYLSGTCTNYCTTKRSRSGRAWSVPDMLHPDQKHFRRIVERFSATSMSFTITNGRGTHLLPLPVSQVPEDYRERPWFEPIETIQDSRATANQGENPGQWDMRYLIPHAIKYLKDHPVYTPTVKTQVQTVIAHCDPSRPTVIIENVRTRALKLLRSLRPLLREPETDIEKWSVTVRGNHNVVLVKTDVEGGVHQQVSIPEIERILRSMPLAEPQRTRSLRRRMLAVRGADGARSPVNVRREAPARLVEGR